MGGGGGGGERESCFRPTGIVVAEIGHLRPSLYTHSVHVPPSPSDLPTVCASDWVCAFLHV